MKTITLSYIVFLISFNCFSQTRKESDIRTQPLDIVESFLIIPSEKNWAIEGEQYNLFVDRQQILKEVPGKKVVIDKKNAYLSISDTRNELEFRLEMCYFVKTDKTKTIAISYYQEGGDCDSYLLKFYTYSNKKWTDATKTVLPAVSLKDYGVAEKDFMEVDYLYKIPQFGTSIFVTAAFPCEQDMRLKGKDFMTYFEKYKKMALKKLELKWNKEKGKFEKGGLK